jgi:hypothetical protein
VFRPAGRVFLPGGRTAGGPFGDGTAGDRVGTEGVVDDLADSSAARLRAAAAASITARATASGGTRWMRPVNRMPARAPVESTVTSVRPLPSRAVARIAAMRSPASRVFAAARSMRSCQSRR